MGGDNDLMAILYDWTIFNNHKSAREGGQRRVIFETVDRPGEVLWLDIGGVQTWLQWLIFDNEWLGSKLVNMFCMHNLIL